MCSSNRRELVKYKPGKQCKWGTRMTACYLFQSTLYMYSVFIRGGEMLLGFSLKQKTYMSLTIVQLMISQAMFLWRMLLYLITNTCLQSMMSWLFLETPSSYTDHGCRTSTPQLYTLTVHCCCYLHNFILWPPYLGTWWCGKKMGRFEAP